MNDLACATPTVVKTLIACDVLTRGGLTPLTLKAVARVRHLHLATVSAHVQRLADLGLIRYSNGAGFVIACRFDVVLLPQQEDKG